MATIEKASSDQLAFESAIKALEAQAANVGVHLTVDASTRLAYAREINKMAGQLRQNAAAGKITWANAAQQAQETRNLVMAMSRHRSTPVGRSIAQKVKSNGRTLNEVIALNTRRMYGDGVVFSNLSAVQKNSVYAAVVASAGKSNTAVNKAMSRLSYAGKGVLFVSVSMSVYTIATSNDMQAATVKEVTLTGAGIGGGIAGGAIAGLACGPASPICVTLGAFVGGALSAFGVGMAW